MKNARLCLAALACLLLSGCMTVSHLQKEYAGLGLNTVETKRGTFKVIDNAQTGKIFVEPGFGFSVTQGTPPLPWAREAALQWFEMTRRSCTIVDGYLFQQPHYEFIYTCGN